MHSLNTFRDEWGHFAVMAREKNNAVGCALVYIKNEKPNKEVPYHYMLTCNYAETNFKDTIYDHGEACTQCKTYGPEFNCDKAEYHRLCMNFTEEKFSQNGTRRFGKCYESMCLK